MKKLSILFTLLLILTQSANAQRYGAYRYDDALRFRIGLQGGWSYRTAPLSKDIPAEFRDYAKKLKSGFHYGANAAFFFTSTIGAGIEYSGFRAKNETDIWLQDPATKKIITGKMVDDITISYVGPSFVCRYIFGANDNFHILGTASIGYLSYKNEGALITGYTLTAGTLGFLSKFGFDLALHKNIFVGVELAYMGGSMNKFDYGDAAGNKKIELPEGEYEKLSRVDASAGLRFNF